MTTRPNLMHEAREVLSTTVVVSRGAKRQQLSLFSAILLKEADRAMQGNESAAKIVFEVAERCGMFDDNPPECAYYNVKALSEDELSQLERIQLKLQLGAPGEK
jgi:hypothetical protein